MRIARWSFVLIIAAACAGDDPEAALRARFAAALVRADSAAPFVDTIIARPDSLLLSVGDTVRLSFTALDSNGDTLTGFIAQTHAGLQYVLDHPPGTSGVAAQPGRTVIRVTPATSRVGLRTSDATTVVPVIVTPRSPD